MTGGRDVTLLADEDLMPLVRAGDAAAFEVVYERHCGAAFSLAYRMTGRRGAAEDVVQEAFLSLWRAGARYDQTRGSVRTWVLAVVHHRAIDALRRGLKHDSRRASWRMPRRSASIPRWWTIPSTHVRTLPRVRSYRAPERHSDRNASCTTSSAAPRRPIIR